MRFTFTTLAKDDLDAIFDYTWITWGEQQARDYQNALEKTFVLLTENPKMGLSCNNLVAGMRRFIVGKHTVYYREEANKIIIHRVIHQTRQLSSDMLQ